GWSGAQHRLDGRQADVPPGEPITTPAAVDEGYARRLRWWRWTRRLARDDDRLRQRSIRIELEGVADIHVPLRNPGHPLAGAPDLTAVALGIAGSRCPLGWCASRGLGSRGRTRGGRTTHARGEHSAGH